MNTDVVRLWGEACSLMESELSEKDFQTWIQELNPRSFEGDTLTLEAPFGLYRDRIRQSFLPAIENAVSVVADKRCRVAVVVGSLGETRRSSTEAPRFAGGRGTRAVRAASARKTFRTFVVGDSNRMAFNAARQLVDGTLGAGNPLFVYGDVGLGKTHLLMAITNELRSQGKRVVYYPGEDFTRRMVDALRSDRMETFRREFRLADAFLIDDVQFLAGKKRTQQELYHAFNFLHAAGKPIALASDRSPADLEKLEQGLRNRFEGGLIVDLRPLDRDLRLRILKAKIAEAKIEIEDDLVERLAVMLRGSVREIEGVVARLRLAASDGGSFDRGVVELLVAPFVQTSGPVNPDLIVDTVSWTYGVSREELLSPDRARRVAWPRHIAAYLCRRLTSASLPEIGQVLGGRSHTTILRAVRSVQERVAGDPRFSARLSELERMLGSRGGALDGRQAFPPSR